jgi:hypothetical protein
LDNDIVQGNLVGILRVGHDKQDGWFIGAGSWGIAEGKGSQILSPLEHSLFRILQVDQKGRVNQVGGAHFRDLTVLNTPVLSLQIGGQSADTTILVHSEDVKGIDLILIFGAERDDSNEFCGAAGVGNGGI